jgi:hypothetical protein
MFNGSKCVDCPKEVLLYMIEHHITIRDCNNKITSKDSQILNFEKVLKFVNRVTDFNHI